jgi:NAD(P)-dependent dehydrogenase (short-subunit alcohol dehydrogenase family)
MDARFAGKVAIITGAAHGLGASHARAFAREGANVIVTDICHDQGDLKYSMGKESEMYEVVREIERSGGQAIGIKCDVTQARDVEEMVGKVVNRFGKVDILVNNAGIAFVATPLWEVSEKSWDLTVDVMLKGTFLCCKFVLPHMIKQKYGKIVNTSSVGARAQRHIAPYSAVKAGIEILTLATAKDVGEYNINVNCVGPGPVYTPLLQGITEGAARDSGIPPDEFYAAICKKFSILGKEILQQDVSNAVLFLSSEEARNINGSVLYVDGGFLSI